MFDWESGDRMDGVTEDREFKQQLGKLPNR